MSKEVTAYEVAMQGLDKVAKLMDLNDEILGYLRTPQRAIIVELPLRMDDGSLRFFTGYRVQYNYALGPVKGGTRFHHAETLDDVKALAFWMTIKNSLANLPAGGAKGGIAVDPASLSPWELERLCRAYIRAIYPVLGPKVDVPGPDVGTPPQVMAWFMDEYENISQHREPAAFAGKPPLLGGSLGRNSATGYGLVSVAEKVLQLRGQSLEGKAVAIQGFGNLGTYAADAFSARGAKVVAICDVFGGFYDAGGLDVQKALAHVREHGNLKEFAGGDKITGAELLEIKCDILAPCAMQSQIGAHNAERVKASYVIEGANGPTTPEGEEILHSKNVCVVPDIVANAGGTTVSYFELVQDLYHYYWSEEEALAKMNVIMQKSAEEVYKQAVERKITMRQAAWVTALTKVINGMRMRGWIRK